MGFGMIATGEGEVRGLLENNYQGLTSELNRLVGKIEVELKVFWDQEAVIKELQGENQEFSRLKAKINSASSPIEIQNLLSVAGKLVENITRDWKAKYAELVYNILKELSYEAKVNRPADIKNLLNVSYLIDRTCENEFKEQVYKLDSKFQGRINFKYVGPMPPYSFVDLMLEPVRC